MIGFYLRLFIFKTATFFLMLLQNVVPCLWFNCDSFNQHLASSKCHPLKDITIHFQIMELCPSFETNYASIAATTDAYL